MLTEKGYMCKGVIAQKCVDSYVANAKYVKGFFENIGISQATLEALSSFFVVRAEHDIISENRRVISTDHTLGSNSNGVSVDPVIDTGITVTIPKDAVWVIL